MLQGRHNFRQRKTQLTPLEISQIVRHQMLDSTGHGQIHNMVIRGISTRQK